MILLDKTLVKLTSSTRPDLNGKISLYELPSGNHYYVYSVDDVFYRSKEVCSSSEEIIKEEYSDNDYHYSIDILFDKQERLLSKKKPLYGTHFSD